MDCAGALEQCCPWCARVCACVTAAVAVESRPGRALPRGMGPGGDVAALNMPANLEDSAVATGLEKVSFHSKPKKGNAKECSNYRTIALISHAGKVMLKILQARLQKYMNPELPGIQAGFRKGRGTRDQIANIHWIIEKAREYQKNIYFCF